MKLINLLTGLNISSWKANPPSKVFALRIPGARQPGIILSSCLSPPRSYQLDNVPTALFSRYPRTTCFHHCCELPRAEYSSFAGGWMAAVFTSCSANSLYCLHNNDATAQGQGPQLAIHFQCLHYFTSSSMRR